MQNLKLNIDVIVSVPQLIEQLEKNFLDYLETYQEAVEGYIKQCVAETTRQRDAALKAAEDKRPAVIGLHLSPPSDYSDAFRTAISMFRAHQESTIKLTSDQYRALWMGKWDWSDRFIAEASRYSAKAYNIYNSNQG